MEKTGKINIGKTPAEDTSGKKCRRIKDGTPLYDLEGSDENSFDKIASLVQTCSKDKKKDERSRR